MGMREQAIEDRLLKEAMKAAKAEKRAVPKGSYIRVDAERMNAFEAGYIIGHRDAARRALTAEVSLAEARGFLTYAYAFIPETPAKAEVAAWLELYPEKESR